MNFFAETVVKPYILRSGYRRVCEIGASLGQNTDKILAGTNIEVTIVDPCLDLDLIGKYRDDKRVEILKGTSLEVLGEVNGAFDCILIDGDHNWYTVYNELQNIERRNLLRAGGTIFFHDVGWPYARRDLYYQPDLIPGEFRHPYAKKGIVPNQSLLSADSGINSTLDNADHEGGPRNGVLTAIEDFLEEHPGGFRFFGYREEHGLGVLLKTGAGTDESVFDRYRRHAQFRTFVWKSKKVVKKLIRRK